MLCVVIIAGKRGEFSTASGIDWKAVDLDKGYEIKMVKKYSSFVKTEVRVDCFQRDQYATSKEK